MMHGCHLWGRWNCATDDAAEGRKDQVGRGWVISSRKKSTGEVERANMLE